jgi:hypothetical protein
VRRSGQQQIRRARALAAALAAAALLISGCTGGSGGATGPARTVRGLGGDVRLTVPGGAESPGTKVAIGHTTVPPRPPTAGVPNAVPVMAPVAITVRSGRLAPDRVRVTLKLPDGRPAGVYRNAFIAVYEPRVREFVPLLDSRADPRAHTVTALAPHFSVYNAFVDAARTVSGKVINWSDLATMPWLPLIPSLDKTVQGIQQQAIDDLFGFSPALKCSPPSGTVKVVVHDVTRGQLLEACAQDYGDGSGRIHIEIGNHYGFPILYRPPSGFTVGLRDFDFSHGTLFDFIRHLIWMNFNDSEAPGAGNAQMTMQPGTRLPVTVDGNMDWAAVGVDMTYYLATLVLPELADMTPELKTALEGIVDSVGDASSTGPAGVTAFQQGAKAVIGRLQGAAAGLSPLLDLIDAGDCVVHTVEQERQFQQGGLFTNVKQKTAAVWNAAIQCASSHFVDLVKAMPEFLKAAASDLKAFPELAYSAIASELAKLQVDATRSSVKVETPPPPPAPAGTVYGFFTHVGVNPNSVSFDEVQWFFGKTAAAAACKKFHVPGPHYGAVCNDYYINDLHRQLTLPVTGNVKVSDWHGPDGGVVPDHPIPYSQVASLVAQPGGDTYLWKMTVKNGYVTSITGVFRP